MRNIREVKVGDRLVNNSDIYTFNYALTVLEVLQNTVAVYNPKKEDMEWFTKDQLEKYGWITTEEFREIKGYGVDDSEEVFTKEELDGLFALTIGHLNAFSNPDVSDTLFWRTIINKLKLNKMLKEKE